MILEMNAIPTQDGYSIYFKVKNQQGKVYEQRVVVSQGELIIWNCTCMWGSIGRFSKNVKDKDKPCRHVKEIIDVLKFLNYLK